MNRYICIHGHFYQPPRENAWLDTVETQDSAYPYHDWNERITAECYAPNASARILDESERIVRIVNNYSRISFNFGPTLLSWMEAHASTTYRAILEADQDSLTRFSGHGSALALAYNHLILPLANRRDKETQVIWGIRDFRRRFGRAPEGMWLPETAVDVESLEILAENDIRFTILDSHQARLVRNIGGADWLHVEGELDPSMPYEIPLPSGKRIVVFFYDGPISRAVAFENLLTKGEHFAHRLTSAFSEHRDGAQLVHIATDGETYGHHHHHGDMALAYALDTIESRGLAQLTNYGEFLEKHPPRREAQIRENTSWSCIHGVERWRSDCGCSTGAPPGWNQAWRRPLREAFDWLRDRVAPRYAEHAGRLLRDPWAARNDYIDVLLDRSTARINEFLDRHALKELSADEMVTALELLELQRHAMLMYTSCGWFFNEVSGIETVQVMQYAARVIQLAEKHFGEPLEEEFLGQIEQARSNKPDHGNGRKVYERYIRPAAVDLARVAAHYAVHSTFEPYPTRSSVYSYEVTSEKYESYDAGRGKVIVGRVRVVSEITRESAQLSFGVLYLGDVHLTGGIREYRGEEAYRALEEELANPDHTIDFPAAMRLLEKHFGDLTLSLKSLFRDEQRRILNMICNSTLSEAETAFRQLHDRYFPLMRFHTDLGIPLPKVLSVAAEFDLNLQLRRAFERDELPLAHIQNLFKKVKSEKILLDDAALAYTLKQTIDRLVDDLVAHPENLEQLQRLESAVDLAQSLPFEIDLWKAQNAYYRMSQTVVPDYQMLKDHAVVDADIWLQHFRSLGDHLSIRNGL